MPKIRALCTSSPEEIRPDARPFLGRVLITLSIFAIFTAGSLFANGVVSWGRQVIPPASEWKPLIDLEAGGAFNLGLRPDRTVVAWGSNNHRESTVPEGLTGVSKIAAGARHALALRRDGTVVAWGDNRLGQITPPGDLGAITAIGAGMAHSVALDDDGNIRAWGDDRFNQTAVPGGLDEVVAIAVGSFHNLALRRDGTVVAWGLNEDGQATVPSDLTDVVAIAAGGYHSLALRSDGTVVAWGNNDFGQATPPDHLSRHIIRIDAGEDHSLALLENGEVYAWGRNHYGQADFPSGLSDIRRIAAGAHHNVVLTLDGGTFAWGNNSHGQALNPEDLQEVVAVSAHEDHTIALKEDGSIFSWGIGGGTFPEVRDLQDVVAVAAGRAHGLALREDGSVVTWGDNLYGQTSVPDGLENVVGIAAGDYHSLALREDGQVFAWGSNFQQQASVPADLTKIVDISAGQEHSAALNSGGLVFVWGNNFYGQREVPSNLREAIAITSGSFHNVALRGDGVMSAWGSEFFDQTEIPLGLSDVVAIDAGRSHTVAVRENRTAIGWGSNYYSQSEVPAGLGEIVDAAAGGDRTVIVTGELRPPRLFSDFESRMVPAGEDLFLMPRVTGSPPFLYQWMKNGRPISDENGPALSLPQVTAADSGSYSLILANPAGNITSQNFILEIQDPAVIVRSTPQVAVIGGSAMFTAEAHGTGPFRYQWLKNGEEIPGATQSDLLFQTVREDDPGIYSVEVTNEIGSTVSEPINFLVEPRIQNQPSRMVAGRMGERMVLSLDVVGSPPLNVQWFYEGNPIADATEAELVLENISLNDTGVYHAIVQNPAGRVVSEPMELEIVPHLTLQPESQIFSASGGTAVFEVRATGTQPLRYTWYKDGATFAQTVEPRLVLERVRPSDAGEYYVVVANSVGRVQSESASLMLPPEIIAHPRSQTARAGDAVNLNVRAIGGEPLEYQWLKDDKAIPGATTPELELPSVSGADTARYSAIVSNPVGTVTSQEGTLSVSPDITRHPTEKVVTEGGTVTLTVEAEGSRPLFYQWTKDGATLDGPGQPTLTIANASPDDSGYYYVVVSNSAGIAVSETVEIEVESR